jgi:hypothetical protein
MAVSSMTTREGGDVPDDLRGVPNILATSQGWLTAVGSNDSVVDSC